MKLTFDVERDWRGREIPDWEEKGLRGENFPYSSEPSFSMIKRSIPQILSLLEENNAQAVFFVTGEVAEHEPDLVDKIIAARHDLGVHTHPFYHPEFKGEHVNDTSKDNLADYSPAEIEIMIRRDLESIQNLGVEPKVFRAGKLSVNLETLKVVKEIGVDDSSIELIGPSNFSNLFLYSKALSLLEERPVTLNPAFIHDDRWFYPLHWIFDGSLILHPQPFGNTNIDSDRKEKWFRNLEASVAKFEN